MSDQKSHGRPPRGSFFLKRVKVTRLVANYKLIDRRAGRKLRVYRGRYDWYPLGFSYVQIGNALHVLELWHDDDGDKLNRREVDVVLSDETSGIQFGQRDPAVDLEHTPVCPDPATTKPAIAVISVRGGMVEAVRANHPLSVLVEDWDTTEVRPSHDTIVTEPMPLGEEAELTHCRCGLRPFRTEDQQ